MEICITTTNCDYHNGFLINECADSSIKIELKFDRITTRQSKKKVQDALTNRLRTELRKFEWLILGKLQIEIHWLLCPVERQETDKIGDLDNITKPIIDSLIGQNGVFVDDSQVNSIYSTWGWKNSIHSKNIAVLILYFNNDYTIKKDNLFFLQTGKAIYTPLNFNMNCKEHLQGVRDYLKASQEKRTQAYVFKSKLNVNVDRFLIYSEYEFHRTRLQGFDKNQIITLVEFEKICMKNEVDIS